MMKVIFLNFYSKKLILLKGKIIPNKVGLNKKLVDLISIT